MLQEVRLRAVFKSEQAWPESLSFFEWVQVEWGGGSKAMGEWGKASVQTDDYHHKLAYAADNYRYHYDRTVKWTKKVSLLRILTFGANYCIAPVLHLFLFRQHVLVEKSFNNIGFSKNIYQHEQT